MLPPITIIVIAVDRRSGAFEAFLNGRLLCRSAAPLLASARVLLQCGHHPATVLRMVRASQPDIVALSAPIGVAAAHVVVNDRFRKAPAGLSLAAPMRPRKRRRPKRTSSPKPHEVTA
jgi:hypothetical protein